MAESKRSGRPNPTVLATVDDPVDLAPWSEPAWNYISSPYYNESHKKLRDYIRKYINENVLPHSLQWEEQGEAPRDEALKWVRTGVPFTDVPRKYRPKDLPEPAGIPPEECDVFHLLVATDETARVEGGVMSSLAGASVIGAPPILHYGTEAQKARWLPGLFTWETSFSLGITEPTAGSDVANIKTTARKTADGQHYIVDGYKKWITGTPWATHMTTAVRTGGPGMGGISLLVIPTDAPGFSWRRIANSGQKAGGASFVTLEAVKVPADHLIGRENEGFRLVMANFNRERFILAVGCNRTARECLSEALRYAHTRSTFGRPLAAHQIIRHKLAAVARDLEAHWAWLEQIAFHVQHSPQGFQAREVAGRIALAKVMGGRLVEKAAREAQQIFGGAGYAKEGVGARVEQFSRDLRMLVVGGGSEEIIEDLAIRQEVMNAKSRGWKL